MTEIDNDDVLVQDELSTLKARADLLNISYHPSIGLEKLRDKIAVATSDTAKAVSQDTKMTEAVKETESERRFRRKREANALVRIRLSCMNPAKAEWDGEIFTTGNALVGSIKKYVPFNAEDGWHVPQIIYEQIIQRQCQIFYAARDVRGNAVRKGKLIKEFAVEVLPPLTVDELKELALRQAATKAID